MCGKLLSNIFQANYALSFHYYRSKYINTPLKAIQACKLIADSKTVSIKSGTTWYTINKKTNVWTQSFKLYQFFCSVQAIFRTISRTCPSHFLLSLFIQWIAINLYNEIWKYNILWNRIDYSIGNKRVFMCLCQMKSINNWDLFNNTIGLIDLSVWWYLCSANLKQLCAVCIDFTWFHVIIISISISWIDLRLLACSYAYYRIYAFVWHFFLVCF